MNKKKSNNLCNGGNSRPDFYNINGETISREEYDKKKAHKKEPDGAMK